VIGLPGPQKTESHAVLRRKLTDGLRLITAQNQPIEAGFFAIRQTLDTTGSMVMFVETVCKDSQDSRYILCQVFW
jgi:hypothetical protein